MWDVGILLNYFKEQKPNIDLSLKDLTLKLCALLLLATAQRIQTVHLICLSGVEFKKEECVLYIMDKVKHTRPGHT